MEAYAIPYQEVITVTKFITVHKFYGCYGVPVEMHTNHGRNYDLEFCVAIMEKFQGFMTPTWNMKDWVTPLHLQSHGMNERFNRTLGQHLSKVADETRTDEEERIPLFLVAYTSSVHSMREPA